MGEADYDALIVTPRISSIAGYGQHERYLDGGLLSIGTYLDSLGYNIKIVDLSLEEHDEEALSETLRKSECKSVIINCNNGFAYPSVLRYADPIKKIMSDVCILVFGNHVAGLRETVLMNVLVSTLWRMERERSLAVV